MKRRDVLSLLGSAAVDRYLIGARAAANRMRRIAWMHSFREDDATAQARVKAFSQIIEKLGSYVGGNVAIDYRWDFFVPNA